MFVLFSGLFHTPSLRVRHYFTIHSILDGSAVRAEGLDGHNAPHRMLIVCFERCPSRPADPRLKGIQKGEHFYAIVLLTALLLGLQINQVLSSPAGLMIQRCRWFNITGCTILDSGECGLLLEDAKNCLVTGCLIRGQGTARRGKVAIRTTGGMGNVISGNFLDGSIEIKGGGAQAKNNTPLQ